MSARASVKVEFTFQYGEIKSVHGYIYKCLSQEFTFQYGEIKSPQAKSAGHRCDKFTFQYGEIKSLHGSMHKVLLTKIYIPVWRD